MISWCHFLFHFLFSWTKGRFSGSKLAKSCFFCWYAYNVKGKWVDKPSTSVQIRRKQYQFRINTLHGTQISYLGSQGKSSSNMPQGLGSVSFPGKQKSFSLILFDISHSKFLSSPWLRDRSPSAFESPGDKPNRWSFLLPGAVEEKGILQSWTFRGYVYLGSTPRRTPGFQWPRRMTTVKHF